MYIDFSGSYGASNYNTGGAASAGSAGSAGSGITTFALGEEGGNNPFPPATQILAEEGGPGGGFPGGGGATTLALGEEGGGFPGGGFPGGGFPGGGFPGFPGGGFPDFPGGGGATTFALGEEGGIATQDAINVFQAADSAGGQGDGQLTTAELAAHQGTLQSQLDLITQFRTVFGGQFNLFGLDQIEAQVQNQFNATQFMSTNFAGIADADNMAATITQADIIQTAQNDGNVFNLTPQDVGAPNPMMGRNVDQLKNLMTGIGLTNQSNGFQQQQTLINFIIQNQGVPGQEQNVDDARFLFQNFDILASANVDIQFIQPPGPGFKDPLSFTDLDIVAARDGDGTSISDADLQPQNPNPFPFPFPFPPFFGGGQFPFVGNTGVGNFGGGQFGGTVGGLGGFNGVGGFGGFPIFIGQPNQFARF